MEIKGKVREVCEVENFSTKKGPQSKQGFVVETTGQYPKTVYMVLYGSDKIGNAGLGVGDTLSGRFHASLGRASHSTNRLVMRAR